jgi:hypothetical protein
VPNTGLIGREFHGEVAANGRSKVPNPDVEGVVVAVVGLVAPVMPLLVVGLVVVAPVMPLVTVVGLAVVAPVMPFVVVVVLTVVGVVTAVVVGAVVTVVGLVMPVVVVLGGVVAVVMPVVVVVDLTGVALVICASDAQLNAISAKNGAPSRCILFGPTLLLDIFMLLLLTI